MKRKTYMAELPVYESLGMAAGHSGVPLEVIKAARREGSPGFRNGRVELGPLLKHLFAKPGGKPTVPELESRLLEEQVEKISAQNSILRREWTPTSLVRQWGAELGGKIRTVLFTLHMIAPNLTGLTVTEISAALRRQENELLAQLHTLDDAITAHATDDTGELFTDEAPLKKPHTFKGNARPGSSIAAILGSRPQTPGTP